MCASNQRAIRRRIQTQIVWVSRREMGIDGLMDKVIEVRVGAPVEQALCGGAVVVGVHSITLEVAVGCKSCFRLTQLF